MTCGKLCRISGHTTRIAEVNSKNAVDFPWSYISGCVRRPRIQRVLYQLGKFISDYIADHLHFAAEFGALIFGNAAKDNFNLVTLVGNIFDLFAKSGSNVFCFAAEFGTHHLNLVSGSSVHCVDFVCEPFKRPVRSPFCLIGRRVIGGSDRALVFCDLLTNL